MKRRGGRFSSIAPIAACLALTMGPALAVDTAAVDPITGATEAGYLAQIGPLTIPVTATVSPSCSFDPGNLPAGTISVGNLNNSFDQQIAFGLQCTVQLNVGVVSTNGGLQAPATASAGYSALRNYNVALHVQGTTNTADGDCLASNLTASGSCSFRGPATAAQGVGGLYLNDTAINGTGYVSGSYIRVHSDIYGGTPVLLASPSYADTLTVTLSAVY